MRSLLILAATLAALECRSIRQKRQGNTGIFGPYPNQYRDIRLPQNPGFRPYSFPVNGVPFSPTLPAQHHYQLGMTTTDGNNVGLVGYLRMPLINKVERTFVPFELNGTLDTYDNRPYFEYGHHVNPVNPFEIEWDNYYTCILSPNECVSPPEYNTDAALQRPGFYDEVPHKAFGSPQRYGPQNLGGGYFPAVGYMPPAKVQPGVVPRGRKKRRARK